MKPAPTHRTRIREGSRSLPHLALAAALVAGATPAVRAADPIVGAAGIPTPELLTRTPESLPPGRTGAGPSLPGSFSGNGRYLVFTSAAPDLVPNDPNGGGWDVFRRDLVEGRTEPVSRLAGPDPGLEGTDPSVSQDGTVIAFTAPGTWSGNVSAVTDTNGLADVLLRRMSAPAPELVSVRRDGLAAGNGASHGATVSADGSWVVFESNATDLTSGTDTNNAADVFLRNLSTSTTLRISSVPRSESEPAAAGDGRSHTPRMGGEGAVVVFRSDATDLAPRTGGIATDLHVWTRTSGSVRRVVLPGETVITGEEVVRVSNVALTSDGRHVAFRALTPQPAATSADGVWVVDLSSDAATRISPTRDGNGLNGADTLSGPVLSADGRVAAFETVVDIGGTPRRQIRIWRADTGTLTLTEAAGAAEGPPEPTHSEMPVLDPNGSRLAFLSRGPVPGTSITSTGAWHLLVRELATGRTEIVPSSTDPDAADLPCAEFHPDGQRLAFLSASPLVPGVVDHNRAFDVFIASAGATAPEVVSIADPSVTANSIPGGGILGPESLSADGRHVLVGMPADGDPTGRRHVFLIDRQQGTRQLVSRDASGAPGSGPSTPVAITTNGSSALFLSSATNLVTGDTNAVEDLFLVNPTTGTTALVNARDGGAGFSHRAAFPGAVISGDGRWVAFLSTALDLVPGLSGSGNNLFLRDTLEQRTFWLSRNDAASGITGVQGQARRVVIGDHGRLVAFLAGVSATSGSVYVYDRRDGTRRRVPVNRVHDLAVSDAQEPGTVAVAGSSADGTGIGIHLFSQDPAGDWQVRELLRLGAGNTIASLAFSSDGRTLVFATAAPVPEEPTGVPDTLGVQDVFHYDLATARVRVCSLEPGGSFSPLPSNLADVSGDGRRVVFRQLTPYNPGQSGAIGGSRVRIFDLDSGRATDLPPSGLGPGRHTTTPSISRDGSVVAMVSAAADGRTPDGNGVPDVFAVRVTAGDPGTGADTDLDGLPDAWETEFLGGLTAGATGDPDADGASNLSEYQAGTNPLEGASVFRVVAVPLAGDGRSIVLRWASVAGLHYQIETSPSLVPPTWSPLPGSSEGIGDGSVKTVEVPAADGPGFLRVRVRR